jgi:hypothetical protein
MSTHIITRFISMSPLYSSTSGKLTWSSTGNFGFVFGTNTSNSAYKLLGINNSDDNSESTSRVSDNVCNLSSIENIYILINEDQTKHVFGKNYFRASFHVYDKDSVFRDVFKYQRSDQGVPQCAVINKTKRLSITLFDQSGNQLEMNGSDWHMLLQKCIY